MSPLSKTIWQPFLQTGAFVVLYGVLVTKAGKRCGADLNDPLWSPNCCRISEI